MLISHSALGIYVPSFEVGEKEKANVASHIYGETCIREKAREFKKS